MRLVEDNSKILDFLDKNYIGVLSTITEESKPQGSVVHYVNSGHNIYFLTKTATRKFKNIQNNPNVNFVIYQHNYNKVIHIEGVCRSIEDTSILKKLVNKTSERHSSQYGLQLPPLTQIKTSGSYTLMEIKTDSLYFLEYDHKKTER